MIAEVVSGIYGNPVNGDTALFLSALLAVARNTTGVLPLSATMIKDADSQELGKPAPKIGRFRLTKASPWFQTNIVE